ncbi:MAG: efflux RND transporter periplasmic adaptor subunit [Rhodospirillales bacterium]|nr:efflux RND transporter periplasmic adaptor subunit [Rhodospirillales bacterium]
MKQAVVQAGLGLLLALVVLGYLLYDRGYVPESVLALPQADHAVAALGVAADDGPQQFTCPMHPHYIATDPDGTCPICGMDLVPVQGQAAAAEGDGVISVAPEMVQTMGVRTAPAEHAPFARLVRAFGNVDTDERLETVSASRLEGWIEDLTVRAEGDSVRVGELLYRVYSPELIAAQKDYLASLQIGNENRIAAVRQRLRSVGMQPAAIERLTETREVIERVPVYAEATGTVSRLDVREGDYVKPGTPVLRLQSYADVWVIASIPEAELSSIEHGLAVFLSFPSAPQAPAEGRVDYIYPTIDPHTRTADVRIVVDNSAGHLRPGAYADVRFLLDAGKVRLSVPSEAILRDSRGAHVIVSLGGGRFAGRAVDTGQSASGRTAVLTGLAAGEEVVTSGQFMLDSEVSLRGGLARLEAPPAMLAGPDTPLSELPVDATTLAEIDHLVDMALYFHEALVDDYRIDPYFVDPALQISDSLKVRFGNTRLVPIIENAQAALHAAKESMAGQALASDLASLMAALESWLLEGAPAHYHTLGLRLYLEDETGRLWLQLGDPPANPYGANPATIVEWPDLMAGMEEVAVSTERAPVNPHAGHGR